MAYTEAEARTKWCPFAHVMNLDLADDERSHVADDPTSVPVVSEANPHNRLVVGDGNDPRCSGDNCLGSACMAWRWTKEGRGDGPVESLVFPRDEPGVPPSRPGFRWYCGGSKDDAVEWGLFPRLGYCGLAGSDT